MKLFLDDVRNPSDCLGYMHTRIGKLNPIYSEDWVVVRNYDEFMTFVNKNVGKITHVSFDHDLEYIISEDYPEKITEDNAWCFAKTDDNAKTGLDCAKYLKQIYSWIDDELPIMFVHSMNPVGTQNIINLFKS